MSRDEQLLADVQRFADRMIILVTELHNALEDDDKGRQRTSIEAMVGLVEMLRSAAEESGNKHD